MVDNSIHETQTPATDANGVYDEPLEQIRQALLGLRFGTVSIIV